VKIRLTIVTYSKRAKWVIYPTATLVMINFIVFGAGSAYLGGDALNGYIQAGHYFLCAHGQCTQVSSATWHYSFWHAYAAMGCILLLFGEVALFLNLGDIEWK